MTLILATLPLIGMGLIVWALVREPLYFWGYAGLFLLLMASMGWIAKL